ncbi:hypothetical protein BGZ65_005051 [Modicella reniformis]|uniref:Uncharacterized protein n=1 Tax=Modicella reniformis TaxID=1440133 RepID=A0A9P6IXR9_9FUNG|nr:hypothetical protein BGZ65_005051 [Modicella reniformis]
MKGQDLQATNIIQSINQHLDRLHVEHKTFQEQSFQMQKEMLQMQEETLERLAIIQARFGIIASNLHMIVTPEGHVKWVCFDHYRANYRESAIQQLREVVELNRGKYIEETGRIEIEIRSNTLAKQFFDTLVKARGIQELDITLQWDATMDDLRLLAKAVTKAIVISLTVDGDSLHSDLIQSCWHPILESERSISKAFHRISKPSLILAQKFRVFSMKLEVSSDEKTLQSFQNILEQHGSLLTALDLKLPREYWVAEAISIILRRLQKLESLRINSGKCSIAANVSQGKMQTTGLIIEELANLAADLKSIQKAHQRHRFFILTYFARKSTVGVVGYIVASVFK